MRISDWSSDVCSSDLRVLVGHNIAFDLAILRHEAERVRLAFRPPAAVLDIGLLYAGLRPRVASITLETVAEDFGVAIDGRHTALGDAEATARIWTRLLPALGQRSEGRRGGKEGG